MNLDWQDVAVAVLGAAGLWFAWRRHRRHGGHDCARCPRSQPPAV